MYIFFLWICFLYVLILRGVDIGVRGPNIMPPWGTHLATKRQDQATSAIVPHGPASSASNQHWLPWPRAPFLDNHPRASFAAESVEMEGSMDDLWIDLWPENQAQIVQRCSKNSG